jgi:hypothetical protein
MPDTQPVQIKSTPGIKRDGTRLEGDGYVDGQWVRFDRGLPRKMGGYRSINRYLNGPVRSAIAYTRDALVYLHFGSAGKVERLTVDQTFNTSLIFDRTPLTLDASPDNLWQFDVSVQAGQGVLLAQVAPNLVNITNSLGGQLFIGDLFATTPLTEVTLLPAGWSATGGVMSLFPYAVAFGNNGWVMWSVPGIPDDYTGSGAGNAYVTAQKIVFGLPLRGGGDSAPSALLWSADSLIRMTYTGPDATGAGPVFRFDTLSVFSSIISSSCVVEYDGVYYWAGVDRFLMFNGVVREVPNLFNKDFFFDGLNWPYRQKVFAFKVPRWGEIWWCYPRGDSTEPNHAVVFNVRENTWYDTALPRAGRTSAVSPGVFRYPAATGATPGLYSLQSFNVNDTGVGYAVGDLLQVQGSSTPDPTIFEVVTVDGLGALITASIYEDADGKLHVGHYPANPGSPATTIAITGTGTGATFDVVYEAPYRLWVHEIGHDEIDGATSVPVESYFETGDVSLPITQNVNKATRVVYIEPDFVQSGLMTVQIRGNANARSPDVISEAMPFKDTAATVNEQVIFFKTQRRELRFRFASNVLGGDYLMGICLAHVGPGDGTMLG